MHPLPSAACDGSAHGTVQPISLLISGNDMRSARLCRPALRLLRALALLAQPHALAQLPPAGDARR